MVPDKIVLWRCPHCLSEYSEEKFEDKAKALAEECEDFGIPETTYSVGDEIYRNGRYPVAYRIKEIKVIRRKPFVTDFRLRGHELVFIMIDFAKWIPLSWIQIAGTMLEEFSEEDLKNSFLPYGHK